MTATLLGWRKVALILASGTRASLLAAMGIPQVTASTVSWARERLDRVDRFFEDGDADPRTLVSELEVLAGPGAIAALTDAADLLSKRRDVGLPVWRDALETLVLRGTPAVPIPDGLSDRACEVLGPLVGPRERIVLPARPETYDDWTWAFWRKQHVEPEAFADDAIELRHIRTCLRRLAETLTPDEKRALETWANAHAWLEQPAPDLNQRSDATRQRMTFSDAD